MDIWFIKLIDNSSLNRIDLNKRQKLYSKIFLKKILEQFYNNHSEILNDGGRKYLADNSLYFSISHSNNLISYVFDKKPVGIDVEYIRERKFKNILSYYGIDAPDILKEEFYKIWTTYEAEYKSKTDKNLLIFKYLNYICSLSFENDTKPLIYEIDISEKETNENELVDSKLDDKSGNKSAIKKIEILPSSYLSPSNLKIK